MDGEDGKPISEMVAAEMIEPFSEDASDPAPELAPVKDNFPAEDLTPTRTE